MVKFSEIEVNYILLDEGLRKTPLEEDSLRELADSIAKHGVLQPITVEPPDEEGWYRLLIGERRTRAAIMAGLDTIPAQILDKPIDPNEVLEKRLVENLHREGLDPIDEAESYAKLKKMGYTISAIGRSVGKSRQYVSQRMKMLKLHPILRETVRHRTLTPGHANALLRLKPDQQLKLATQTRTEGLSVKETRKRVRDILGKPLKWHLIPLHLSLDVYDKLQKLSPKGNVKELIKQTIIKLVTI